jgi:hypothetical protein
MPPQGEAGRAQARLPPGPGADGGRLGEQAVLFFLLRQADELGVQGMVRRQERFFAMQHRRVVAGGVVVAIEPAVAQRQADGADEGRVRVGVEVGIDEVRQLPGAALTRRAERREPPGAT